MTSESFCRRNYKIQQSLVISFWISSGFLIKMQLSREKFCLGVWFGCLTVFWLDFPCCVSFPFHITASVSDSPSEDGSAELCPKSPALPEWKGQARATSAVASVLFLETLWEPPFPSPYLCSLSFMTRWSPWISKDFWWPTWTAWMWSSPRSWKTSPRTTWTCCSRQRNVALCSPLCRRKGKSFS